MRFLVFIVIILLHGGARSQKIQYSRQQAVINYPDAMQLVANVAGNHHLLTFFAKKNPVVSIFDAQLRLFGTKQLPLKMASGYDLKVIKFKSFYYLYAHVAGSLKHELWRIDKEGNVVMLTKQFEQLLKAQFKKIPSVLQLSSMDDKLCIVSHMYFQELEKLTTTVLATDSTMASVWLKRVSFDFAGNIEKLQQVNLLSQQDMLILKTSRNDLHTLEILKVNFDTGSVISTVYSSSIMYSEPAFVYNHRDSTVIVHAMLRGGYQIRNSSFFISQLDDKLKERVPVTLLKSQFRNNASASFLLLNVKTPIWLAIFGYRNMASAVSYYSNQYNSRFFDGSEPGQGDYSLLNQRVSYSPGRYGSTQPNPLRFSLLNNRFKITADSLVANNDKVSDIQMQQYARFEWNNKCYLLLKQQFTKNRNGLLLVNNKDADQIEANDVRVIDKYEYVISQLQLLPDGTVILPYTYRRDAGLLKLTPGE